MAKDGLGDALAPAALERARVLRNVARGLLPHSAPARLTSVIVAEELR